MSLDPSATISPASSGRSSPAPRAPRRSIEDALYKKDKGYRRYAAQVERALALFDTAQQEWADYISFLGRLLKAIQTHPADVRILPHTATVATRLAQCLDPSLPSGVHQKALEVYSYIFSFIGKDSLSRDLPLYFPGLSSVLSFASLSVRPLFLSLVETYILALDVQTLRPALKAIILSLLPGLEEETSEDFERMVQAFDKIQSAVKTKQDGGDEAKGDAGDSYFWQCFFLATITNPSRRQGALAFLVRRLPKFGVSSRLSSNTARNGNCADALPKAAEAAISPEPGLLIRCFAAGLSDTQLLIQRGFLDLLVSHLPLDSPVLQERINKEDMERLVAAAANVVARRDMSLNRRLYSWFLGPEPTAATENEAVPRDSKSVSADVGSHHATYFARYGYQPLKRSIMTMINHASNLPADRARPLRICLSLMDRWEIGGLLVPDIFIPALQSVHSYSETASKEQLDEVMRSASIFFDGVESNLIWSKLIELGTSALSSSALNTEKALRSLKLVRFILSRFNVREEEMLLHHMPLMSIMLLSLLDKYATDHAADGASDEPFIALAIEITDSLIQSIPERALSFPDSTLALDTERTRLPPRNAIHGIISSFYSDSNANLETPDSPFKIPVLAKLILREAGCLFAAGLRPGPMHAMLEVSARILSTCVFKTGGFPTPDEVDFLNVFQRSLMADAGSVSTLTVPFPSISAIITVLTALQSARPSTAYFGTLQLPDLIPPLVSALWNYLSPFQPKYHVEVVRCLWQLHAISASQKLVEASITSLMAGQGLLTDVQLPATSADAGRRFALLWTHTMHEQSIQFERGNRAPIRRSSAMSIMSSLSQSPGGFQSVLTRPLLILLDALSEEHTELFAFVRGWLQDLPSLYRVFDVLASHIHPLHSLQEKNSLVPGQKRTSDSTFNAYDDTKECLYYLKHLANMLRWSSHYTWVTLAEQTVSGLDSGPRSSGVSLQAWILHTSVKALSIGENVEQSRKPSYIQDLHRTSVSIILQVLMSPFALALRELELEVPLMARLKTAEPSLQSLLLEAILAALKLRIQTPPPDPEVQGHLRKLSKDLLPNPPRPSMALDTALDDNILPVAPPPQLVDCLKNGFSSPSGRLILDDWVRFLAEVLPLFADTIFQNLIPLVECFCGQISQTFEQLQSTFNTGFSEVPISPESTLISLMNGLEQILAKAHDRLMMQEYKAATIKSPEQPQGFLSNMVSGVFASETAHARTPTANTRLTVLLCFQDTVRICFSIWSWGVYGSNEGKQDLTSLASFNYTAVRMRSRARRILEHLFAAEALECLETLAVIWRESSGFDRQPGSVLSLLNVLNGSKPKNTVPAIFNAVYSRTNPNALDPLRISTLTSDLHDTDLVAFLVDYTRSLEDDAMDEIWTDCTAFLRDVLANPMPHRQILPMLLEFTAMLGQKVDNTNFGEQRKMRRELGDLFMRLLTAMFTTQSLGFLQEATPAVLTEKPSTNANGRIGNRVMKPMDVVAILSSVVANLPLILVDNDRIANAATTISSNMIGPVFRAKAFPENVSGSILDLLFQLTRVSQSNKTWKKDILDAFNDPRFFSSPASLVSVHWLPVIQQWTQNDKDRMPELLSRLSAPTTAGIMFGVGATSARVEADRKTQLNLRRICVLILAAPEDTFVPNLPQLSEKLVELLTATSSSSPSSSTRAELFMLLRTLVLKTSPVHLAPLWPILNSELHDALFSVLPHDPNHEKYNNASILQACKLLDTLVTIDPDDFQLCEWLYVTDTIDAVYKPATWHPTALADAIAEALAAHPGTSASEYQHTTSTAAPAGELQPKRRPFLSLLLHAVRKDEDRADVRNMSRPELVGRVLRPFFGQLSIVAFESTYGMSVPDVEACTEGLLADLFDE